MSAEGVGAKFLSKQEKGEPMSDLIRRDDVLRLAECGKLLSGFYGERAKDIIKAIPSAEPKVGRWIPYKAYFSKSKDSWTDELKCSECGYEWGDEDYNFCPNCGAWMKGE